MVITSTGGLPQTLSKEAFFSGVSAPRNKELMRVYKDLKLVEHLGSGMSRILRKYNASIFTFMDNFLKVTFKFEENKSEQAEKFPERFGKTQKNILNEINENSYITQEELAKKLNISVRAIKKNMDNLKKMNLLKRVGPDKGGHWEIIE